MKLTFEDKSYIEVSKSNAGKMVITIVARDNKEELGIIANSVELTMDQFVQLFRSEN